MPVGFCSIPSENVKTAVCGLRGQDDAAVKQIASMHDSYGYRIVNCVWPHYRSILQLAGVFCNKLTADASMYYADHLDSNLLLLGAVQGLYTSDPTRTTCPRACSMCGSYPATRARSHRSGIYLP